MQPTKMAAGAVFPEKSWPAIEGGTLNPGIREGWSLLVVNPIRGMA